MVPLGEQRPPAGGPASLLITTLLVLALTSACSRSTPNKPPVEEEPACSIHSPLTPGVPGSPGHLVKSERNPNGDSELAVLMRKMLSDLQNLRVDVLAKRPPSSFPDNHHRMACVWPSEEAIRSPLFAGLAKNYLGPLNHLKKQEIPSSDSFNSVVAGCLSCHRNFCPGPIHLIENLWIDPAPSSAPEPLDFSGVRDYIQGP